MTNIGLIKKFLVVPIFCGAVICFFLTGTCFSQEKDLKILDSFLTEEILKITPALKNTRLEIVYKSPLQKKELVQIFNAGAGTKLFLRKPLGSRVLGEQIIPLVIENGSQKTEFNLAVKINAWRHVVKTNRHLKRFSVVNLEDLFLAEENLTELPEDIFFDTDEIIGKEAVFSLPKNQVLTGTLVRIIPAIRKGEEVSVKVLAGQIILNAHALALSDGYQKNKILLLNPKTKKKFEAVVTGPGQAEIKL